MVSLKLGNANKAAWRLEQAAQMRALNREYGRANEGAPAGAMGASWWR
jgi:hypothetical protein